MNTQPSSWTGQFGWLVECSFTKWLWVHIPLYPLKLQIWRLLWASSSLAFRQIIECGFGRGMKITYNINLWITLNKCLTYFFTATIYPFLVHLDILSFMKNSYTLDSLSRVCKQKIERYTIWQTGRLPVQGTWLGLVTQSVTWGSMWPTA